MIFPISSFLKLLRGCLGDCGGGGWSLFSPNRHRLTYAPIHTFFSYYEKLFFLIPLEDQSEQATYRQSSSSFFLQVSIFFSVGKFIDDCLPDSLVLVFKTLAEQRGAKTSERSFYKKQHFTQRSFTSGGGKIISCFYCLPKGKAFSQRFPLLLL